MANGDVVCYKDLVKELVDFSIKNAMAVVRKKELNEEDMKVTISSENEIIQVSKSLIPSVSYGEFTGIFKIEKSWLPSFKIILNEELEINQNIWFESALDEFCKAEIMFCCDVSHYPYIEIDFPEDLEVARDRFHYDLPVWELNRRHQSIEKGERNINDALNLMIDFRNVLNKYQIPYHLAWGLCLGAVREGKPLKFDTDLDFVYPKEYENLVWEKVVPEMRKLRCFIAKKEDFLDSDIFINREGEGIEFNCYENTIINGKEKCIYSPKRCQLYWDAHHSNQIQEIEIMGEKFNIPSNVENYLKGFYGNWKTPSNTKPKSF